MTREQKNIEKFSCRESSRALGHETGNGLIQIPVSGKTDSLVEPKSSSVE
jgi:hypothetical protein